MLPFTQLHFNGLQCYTHTLRDTVTLDGEPPMRPGLPAAVGEPQKIERLRFPFATFCSALDRKTTELDQPRLAFVKLQAKLGKPAGWHWRIGVVVGATGVSPVPRDA